MERVKGYNYCYTVPNILFRGDNSSESFYQKFHIGKNAHDRLLKFLELISSRIIYMFLQYQIYYSLSDLGAYCLQLLPHFWWSVTLMMILKISSLMFSFIMQITVSTIIWFSLIFFSCSYRASKSWHRSTLMRSHMFFSISMTFVRSVYLG